MARVWDEGSEFVGGTGVGCLGCKDQEHRLLVRDFMIDGGSTGTRTGANLVTQKERKGPNGPRTKSP